MEKKSPAEEEKPQYFGLAIGFCVVAGAYGAGVISGGAFNPAVALSLDITSLNKGRALADALGITCV